MPKIDVLVEVIREEAKAFELHAAGAVSETEAIRSSEGVLDDLVGMGLDVSSDLAPVPMFGESATDHETFGLTGFASPNENDDVASTSNGRRRT